MRLHFVDQGRGPTALLLHGLVPGSSVFAGLAARLSETHRVLAPDLPGYPGSTPLPAPFTVAQTMEILAADLRALQVSELSVVGYSGGAYRALWLALSGAFRVRHVVLLAGFADLPVDHRGQLDGLAKGLDSGAVLLSDVAPGLFTEAYLSAHPDAVRQVLDDSREISTPALAAELVAIATCDDLRPRLPSLAMPVVARIGNADRSMPVERSRDVIERVSHGSLEIVEGAGHALLTEDFDATVESVRHAIEQ